MEIDGSGSIIVLQEWRAKTLDTFLWVVTLVTLPALFAILAMLIRMGEEGGLIALWFIFIEVLLVSVTLFRRIHNSIRVGIVILIGYSVSSINLSTGGFSGNAVLYIIFMPVIALIFLGKKAGVIVTGLSAFLLLFFTILLDVGKIGYAPPANAPWAGLSTAAGIMIVISILLMKYYDFQENLIGKERRAYNQMLHAQELLEEQNTSLEDKIREHTEEIIQSNRIQTAVYKITDAANNSNNIHDFFGKVHLIVGELMYAENFFIALYNETTGILSFPYFVDEKDEPFAPVALEEFHGMTSYVIRTGNPITHGWEQFNALIESKEVELRGSLNEDGIGAPLKINGKTIGAVFVQSYSKGVGYTAKDDEVLSYIAKHIASALLRFRALEAERQRTTELTIINSIQSGLAAELSMQAIIDLIGDKLREAFTSPNLVVTYYDEKTSLVHYLYAYEENERFNIPPQAIQPGGVLERLFNSHSPQCLEYGGRKELDPPVVPGTLVCKSGIAAPIISSDRFMGAIQLEDFERERDYGESIRQLLTTIASTLGAALEKVELSCQRNEAIEALRKNEEILQKIVNNLPQHISIWDLNLECTYVSPAVFRLTGFTPEERLALKKEEFIDPESLGLLELTLSEALAQDSLPGSDPNLVVIREIEEYRKDGSKGIFESTYTFLRDAEGHPTGILAITADIAERKKVEAQRDEALRALKQSERMYRLITENSDDVIWTTDKEYHLTYVSPSIVRLRGIEPEAALREDFSATMTPESLKRIQEEYARVLPELGKGENKTVRLEIEQYRADNSTVWVEISRRPIRDVEGGVTGFVGVSRDISERKHTEQALRESERRLTDIINFLPIATLVIDKNGQVTAWNRAAEEMTGVKRENMIGKGNYEYALPFYGRRIPILIDHVIGTEKKLRSGYKNIKKVGEVLSAEAYAAALGKNGISLIGFASPLYDANGQVCGAIESFRDVSDIKEAEAKLKEAKKAAETANRSKSIFLANMSHEIRTPMNAILGFAQLMKRDPSLSAHQSEHLEIINRSGEHLLALINDILELSKIEAGRAVFMPGTFNLYKLLNDMEMMFRIRTDDKRLWLTMEHVGEVPEWIVSDEGKLRQILINLIGNAVKFTEKGGIGVRVGIQPDRQTGKEMLQFDVEDTGPGISPEELGKLFVAFEQASSGIKMGGTGLGLALCRGFIKIMGGEIAVSSTPGKGSIFRFVIPFKTGEAVHVEEKGTKLRVERIKPGQGEIRILVADDRETNRQFLSEMLSAAGFTVHEVTNGAEAVEANHDWNPRVILMDMSMPVMSGYEAMQKIKNKPEGRETIIIAITASAFQEDKQRALAAGADGYLSKPFREEELFNTLRELSGVEFLYQEEFTGTEKNSAMDGQAWQAAIAKLPDSLIRACREAAENGDIFRLKEILNNIAQTAPAVAQRLDGLANKYAYEEILSLLAIGESYGK